MKKLLLLVATIFLITTVFNAVGFAQGKKGGAGAPAKAPAAGGKKAKPPRPKLPTHEEFMAMYDRDKDGEVTMEEFMEGPRETAPGEKGGQKAPK